MDAQFAAIVIAAANALELARPDTSAVVFAAAASLEAAYRAQLESECAYFDEETIAVSPDSVSDIELDDESDYEYYNEETVQVMPGQFVTDIDDDVCYVVSEETFVCC